MKKTRILLLLFVGLFSLASLTSCSSDDDDNLFVGKWQVMRIEYLKLKWAGTSMIVEDTIVKDYSSDNKVFTFRSNGRLDGFWDWEHTTYSYNDQRIYVHDTDDNMENTYEYSFSDDKKTLRLKLMKYNSVDVIYARSQRHSWGTNRHDEITVLNRIE